MTYKEFIETKSSMEFADWISDNMVMKIPESIESTDDLRLVSELLGNTANKISYLSNLLSYAKVIQREAKRKGGTASKLEVEDLTDKKEVLSNALEAMILQHKALSRMITVRQEIMNELKLSGGGEV